MQKAWGNLVWATTALVVLQIVHGFVPGDAEEEQGWGLYLGLVALIVALTALFGVLRRRPWGPTLSAINGVATGAGFLLYHGLPEQMSWNNPYWGDASGTPLQWLSVWVVVAAGIWCAVAARAVERPAAAGGRSTAVT